MSQLQIQFINENPKLHLYNKEEHINLVKMYQSEEQQEPFLNQLNIVLSKSEVNNFIQSDINITKNLLEFFINYIQYEDIQRKEIAKQVYFNIVQIQINEETDEISCEQIKEMTSKLLEPKFSKTNHKYVSIFINHEETWSLIISNLQAKIVNIYCSNKLSEDGLADINDCMKDIYALFEQNYDEFKITKKDFNINNISLYNLGILYKFVMGCDQERLLLSEEEQKLLHDKFQWLLLKFKFDDLIKKKKYEIQPQQQTNQQQNKDSAHQKPQVIDKFVQTESIETKIVQQQAQQKNVLTNATQTDPEPEKKIQQQPMQQQQQVQQIQQIQQLPSKKLKDSVSQTDNLTKKTKDQFIQTNQIKEDITAKQTENKIKKIVQNKETITDIHMPFSDHFFDYQKQQQNLQKQTPTNNEQKLLYYNKEPISNMYSLKRNRTQNNSTHDSTASISLPLLTPKNKHQHQLSQQIYTEKTSAYDFHDEFQTEPNDFNLSEINQSKIIYNNKYGLIVNQMDLQILELYGSITENMLNLLLYGMQQKYNQKFPQKQVLMIPASFYQKLANKKISYGVFKRLIIDDDRDLNIFQTHSFVFFPFYIEQMDQFGLCIINIRTHTIVQYFYYNRESKQFDIVFINLKTLLEKYFNIYFNKLMNQSPQNKQKWEIAACENPFSLQVQGKMSSSNYTAQLILDKVTVCLTGNKNAVFGLERSKNQLFKYIEAQSDSDEYTNIDFTSLKI